MRQILLVIAAGLLVATGLSSCLSKSTEDEYKEWRETNEEWFSAQQANTAFYKTVTASWDPNARVLVHWYNDTALTRDNLKPLLTSKTDVKYRGTIYDGTPFDSSYLNTSPADSIYRSAVNTMVEGWALGLMQMHVGDSCRIVIPYSLGYGSYSMGSVIKPYSTLVFDVKLQDIHAYRTN